jgi:hypothetical protein
MANKVSNVTLYNEIKWKYNSIEMICTVIIIVLTNNSMINIIQMSSIIMQSHSSKLISLPCKQNYNDIVKRF